MVSAAATRQGLRTQRAWHPFQWWRVARRHPRLTSLLLLPLAAVLCAYLFWPRQGIGRRQVNDDVRLPLSPPGGSPWELIEALPRVRFFEPTCVVPFPGEPSRWLVLERRGSVQLVAADPAAEEKRLVLDLTSQVSRTPYDDDGAISLVLHPEFALEESPHRGLMFLYFTSRDNDRPTNRLARYRWDEASRRFDPASETVLIDQLNENLWHNGGALAFGPDGFLYLGMGDEGTDADGLRNSQRLNRDLYCGILRIDVDRRGGAISHPPRRQPETGMTAHYFIPSDNPFVGEPGVLEEFWAHGLRNPYRAAFDSQGRLWAAEVGHLRREEINLIVRGGNYGWSYREGTLPFNDSYLQGRKPEPYYGMEQPPLFEYAHLNGNTCVIGGYYYEGEQLPELRGCYLYADNGSGRVFALRTDGSQVEENRELLNIAASSKTGIASLSPDAEGEPLVVVLGENDAEDGRIYRLVRASREGEGAGAGRLPRRLSETGLFTSTAPLAPAAGVYPYAINAPSWHDGARSRYWILLPGKGNDPDPAADRIEYSPHGAWRFPSGTVLVQHLDFPVGCYPAEQVRPLETRLLVRTSGAGVYGLSYRWNEEGTDAELVTEPGEVTFPVTDTEGVTQPYTWHYLESSTCLVCHNSQSGFVLGLQAGQLQGEFLYPSGVRREQLREWSRSAMFADPPGEEELQAVRPLAPPEDETATLTHRARSYLQANCAHCHRPGGVRAHFDARLETPLREQLLLDTLPHACGAPEGASPETHPEALRNCAPFGLVNSRLIAPGDPARSILYYRMATIGLGRMPHVGSRIPDRAGLRLMHNWIASLPPARDVLGSERVVRELRLAAVEALSLGSMEDARRAKTIAQMISTTGGALVLLSAIDAGALPPFVVKEIVAAGAGSNSIEIRGLFQSFLPETERDPTLRPEALAEPALAIPGDPERGRALYWETASLQCKSCHRIGEAGGEIGPELSLVGKRLDRARLLDSILHPSREIAPEFRSWLLVTRDGRQYTGLLIDQGERTLTLRAADGATTRVAREEIDLLEEQPLSLMPEGLLQGLTPEQVADLLAYLESLQ